MDRRKFGLVLLLFISVTVSGCIFFDGERRSDMTGPSWEVPLAIPLMKGEMVELGEMLKDEFELKADSEGYLGFEQNIGKVKFELPKSDWKPPENTKFPGFSIDIEQEVDVLQFQNVDEPDDVQVVFREIRLMLKVHNELNINGKLHLTAVPLFDGERGEAKEAKPLLLSKDEPYPEFALTISIEDEPDKLLFTGSLRLDEGEEKPEGKLVIDTDAWVPISFEIPSQGAVIDLGTNELDFSDDDRKTIESVPISDVALVVEAESNASLGFKLDLEFDDGSGVPATVGIEAKAGEQTTSTIRIDEKVRAKMTAPGATVTQRLTLFGPADKNAVKLSANDSFTLDAYAIVTVDVNKGEDQ